MSLSADLTAASWKVFSELLDRGLELPVEQRAAWVDGLDAEHDTLKPALRAVLERSGGAEIAQWLDTLPHTAGAAFTEDGDLHADALVGPYRLLREIGVGGMGAVWLAERADGSLKRRVALKLPRASWSRGSLAMACGRVTGFAGFIGTSLHIWLTRSSGMSSTRPTSFMAAFAASVPKVPIWATDSTPYLRFT